MTCPNLINKTYPFAKDNFFNLEARFFTSIVPEIGK